MEPTALFDDGAIVAFIDLVGTFGVGGGAAFHDFVEPYEVGLLHGGFQLVAGLEVDVHRLHVAGREGFFCVGSLGAEGDVKGSPVAQLHAFAVEQETLHHLAQLADSHLRFHRIESSFVGNHFCHFALAHQLGGVLHGIPLHRVFRLYRVAALHGFQEDTHGDCCF